MRDEKWEDAFRTLPFLFVLHLLAHVDELLLVIIELVLQEAHLLRGNHMYTQSVTHLPLTFHTDETLIDVGSHIRVDVQVESFDANLVDQVVNLPFELVSEQDTRLDLSTAETRWAFLFNIHVHSRTNPLTGNLHQAELA